MNTHFLRSNFVLPLLGIVLVSTFNVGAQSSVELYKDLLRFNFLGKVLYIAAHPDDENTAVISYFSNFRNAETAYLSLTRGGGGQNLIGPELRDGLGLIRTRELIEARKVDHGKQFFSTALDFGYSKSSKESFSIWGKQDLLKQVLEVIDHFQPDIIINRFDHKNDRTHGHHTASAMLGIEAFDLLENDSLDLYKDHWKPRRIFHNTSWWFYGSRENFDEAMSEKDVFALDVGIYDPLTGKTNTEIAALSRSQHKSQGFGSSPNYVPRTEYFELIRGDTPSEDIFDGIDTSWNRTKKGSPIANLMDKIIDEYDFKAPYNSVLDLLRVYELVQKLDDSRLKSEKSDQLISIIKRLLRLELQFNTSTPYGVANQELNTDVRAVNLGPIPTHLESITIAGRKQVIDQSLGKNKSFLSQEKIILGDVYSTPFWLVEKSSSGNYQVNDNSFKYLPQTSPKIVTSFVFIIDGVSIEFREPLNYRTNDPVKGEVIEKFHLIPQAIVNFEQSSHLFINDKPQKIDLIVTSNTNYFDGSLSISAPNHWIISPSVCNIAINGFGQNQKCTFSVKPPLDSQSDYFGAVLKNSEGTNLNYQMSVIEYPHIGKHYLVSPSFSKATRLDLNVPINSVAYIKGAGDEIPSSLNSIGIQVDQFDIDQVDLDNLREYKTVVVGIRAYNVEESLAQKNQILWEFAKNGGTLVLQYNTSRNLQVSQLTPFALQLSRLRVTDENSPVSFIDQEHPILNWPNKIKLSDFEGWVQERGLYFASSWSQEFQPVLSMNDPGERPIDGSLLVADYHKGKIIYTGLSFFRQLPNGVGGAFRLFVNLISAGHEKE